MKGLILYHLKENELTAQNYSVLRLLEAGKKAGMDIRVVTPNQFELIVSKSDKRSVLIDEMAETPPDFVLPRMGADTTYFALAVLRQLERLGVPTFNSSKSIESVKDKLHSYQILAQSNLPTPKTMMVKFPVDIDVVEREIGFPVVIKNIIGTKGAGIYLSESKDSFLDLMELIYSYNKEANIILQEFIRESSGKDIRVFVIGGKVVGCMLRKAKSGFKANYSMGGTVESFDLPKEAEWLAIEAARLLDLEITGVDLLFSDDGFKICEANSAPDFEGLEKVIGKHIAEDIYQHVKEKLS